MRKEYCIIKIEAAALNRAELMQRDGDYPLPAGCLEWMGLEITSVIIPMATAFGIRVITTILSDELKESIMHLNADDVVNTTKEKM